MRESSKYLMTVPVKFVCFTGMAFFVILGFLRYMEFFAKGGYGPIHDSLEYYALLLAILGSTSGLIAMLENFFTMRLSETRLIKYLIRLGVTA